MFSGQSRLTPASGILSTNKQIHTRILQRKIYFISLTACLICLLRIIWGSKSLLPSREPPPLSFCAPFHANNTPCHFTHTCNDVTHISNRWQSAKGPGEPASTHMVVGCCTFPAGNQISKGFAFTFILLSKHHLMDGAWWAGPCWAPLWLWLTLVESWHTASWQQ